MSVTRTPPETNEELIVATSQVTKAIDFMNEDRLARVENDVLEAMQYLRSLTDEDLSSKRRDEK